MDILIRAYFLESHPDTMYTDSRVSCILARYQRKSRSFRVGVWYIVYDDGVPACRNTFNGRIGQMPLVWHSSIRGFYSMNEAEEIGLGKGDPSVVSHLP